MGGGGRDPLGTGQAPASGGRDVGGEPGAENTGVFSNEAIARSFSPVDGLPSRLRMKDGEATAPRL